MEAEGVLDIYKRSVENWNIQCNLFIDDDHSSYFAVDKEQPYGAMVFIQKQECVSYATKRMGTDLPNLLLKNKG